MADKIVVNLEWIKQHEITIRQIKGSIEDKALTRLTDTYDGAMGSSKVAGKLDEIMTNWSQEQRKLSDNLGLLASFTKDVHDVTAGQDQANARALEGGQ